MTYNKSLSLLVIKIIILKIVEILVLVKESVFFFHLKKNGFLLAYRLFVFLIPSQFLEYIF